MGRSDHEKAVLLLEVALRSLREVHEDYGVVLVFIVLGMLALIGGDEGRATTRFEKGLALARKLGDKPHTYIALYNLVHRWPSLAATTTAQHRYSRKEFLSEQIGDQANAACCLEGLAVVASVRNQAERCARLIGAAERLHEAVGVPVYVYYEPHRLPYERTVVAVRTRLGEATFEEARSEGRAMTFEQAVAYALKAEEAI